MTINEMINELKKIKDTEGGDITVYIQYCDEGGNYNGKGVADVYMDKDGKVTIADDC